DGNIINEGKGVVLYTYPKSDSSGWATVDTSGFSSWKPMFNDPADWENGAFSRNAKGGFDFGWGVYDQGTHWLNGDSIFVIKTRNGGFMKIRIIQKKSGEDLYTFRFAKLDGTNDHLVTLDLNSYKTTTDFVGYSLEANDTAGYQPPIANWDILFTKYMSVQQVSPGHDTTYPVTGVLCNEYVKSEKFKHVSLDYSAFNPFGWDSTRSSIGYDWKVYNNGYSVVDSLVYFVKSRVGDVYRLIFTKFEGSSTGKIVFRKTLVAGVGINEKRNSNLTSMVYPNPVNSKMNLLFFGNVDLERNIILKDLTGKTLFERTIVGGEDRFSADFSTFAPGSYILQVICGGSSEIQKVIITR
ncbi:MAG: T9SS type A sorting domain-containing protein, partial [Bacteroidota bacterium]